MPTSVNTSQRGVQLPITSVIQCINVSIFFVPVKINLYIIIEVYEQFKTVNSVV